MNLFEIKNNFEVFELYIENMLFFFTKLKLYNEN